MNILRKASHVCVAGKSGMGKTGYGERYIIGSHHGRVFIYDHQTEFQERLKLAPCRAYEEIRQRAQSERIICYDPHFDFPGDLEGGFDFFCEEIFSLSQNYLEPQGIDSLFVCDEVQKVSSANECPPPLKNIMQTGRRFGLDSLTLTQQPNRIHNEQREQITELILFNLTDENSLKFVRNAGLDYDEVSRLEALHYKWFNMVNGETRLGVISY